MPFGTLIRLPFAAIHCVIISESFFNGDRKCQIRQIQFEAMLAAEPLGTASDRYLIRARDLIDQAHRPFVQRRDCARVPGLAANARRISAESVCDPVFFMTAARWFSTVRWLMPRSAAMFLLG
jgi:hypothetical protein